MPLVYPDVQDLMMVPGPVLEIIKNHAQSDIVVYAGAGLSVASGIPTFRGRGGYYQGRDASQLASPEGFYENPVLVWNWYAMRIRTVLGVQPNPGHYALAELYKKRRGIIITSNVDDLLNRVNATHLKLHGNILEMKGVQSGAVEAVDITAWPHEFDNNNLPHLSNGELARPNVVWFGEVPSQKPFEVIKKLTGSELFVEVGTSGNVSYGFTEYASARGCSVLRINTDDENSSPYSTISQPSEIALPLIVEELILTSRF